MTGRLPPIAPAQCDANAENLSRDILHWKVTDTLDELESTVVADRPRTGAGEHETTALRLGPRRHDAGGGRRVQAQANLG